MQRDVQPEWLDELPADNPGAIASRRDLRRLNACMGNAGIIARALIRACAEIAPVEIVELGAGDGTLLLNIAQRLPRPWQNVRAILVDRQKVYSSQLFAQFDQLGWKVQTIEADVFHWCDDSSTSINDAPAPTEQDELLKSPASLQEQSPLPQYRRVVIANLFLHHFRASQLRFLLTSIAKRADVLIGLEPRRSTWSLLVSRLVGLIGCNQVTRHDAPVSVIAGFKGTELSSLWPQSEHWGLEEREAGPFSHLFVASRFPRPKFERQVAEPLLHSLRPAPMGTK
jgi:hypothetical protein